MEARLYAFEMRNASAALIAGLLIMACSTVPKPPAGPADPATALKTTIRAAILQTAPHYKNRGGSLEVGAGTAFTGNFDWHSAVHGHWALLSIARASHDEDARKFVLARLGAAALAAEGKYLDENPDFEMPYGRAWLLLLAAELERQPEVRADAAWLKAVRTLRKGEEIAVVAWLGRTRFPDARNLPRYYTDAQKIRGDHYSWLFPYVFLELAGITDAAAARKFKPLARVLAPWRAEIAKTVHPEFDFLESASLVALSDLLNHRAQAYACDRVALPAQITRANAHRPGAYIADSWPCALGNETAKAAFRRHLDALLAEPALWRDDFDNVGHWVPQFMWLGMWLAAGRP